MFPGVTSSGDSGAGLIGFVIFFRVFFCARPARPLLFVPYLFRYSFRMKHAPESTRRGAQAFSQTHNLIAEILPDIRPCEMQTIYFQAMEDGPETLLAPIEAEFARRGLSPYATYSTDYL